jgi:hypothetical protein
MKHLATIQKEFIKCALDLKIAAGWDDLSYESQKEYLQNHTKSKHRITAKPGRGGLTISDLKKQLENRMQILSPGKGWQSM